MEKIKFVAEDGSVDEFFVEEQTRVNGIDYLLVAAGKEFQGISQKTRAGVGGDCRDHSGVCIPV